MNKIKPTKTLGIDRLKEIEDKVEAKYTRLLGEATEIAREALDILHGLKDKVDRG